MIIYKMKRRNYLTALIIISQNWKKDSYIKSQMHNLLYSLVD